MLTPHPDPVQFLDSFSEFHFVHIPKTGGTFIRKGAQRPLPARVSHWQNICMFNHGHTMAHTLSGSLIDSAAKFAIVRNPFDWFVSMYEHGSERYINGWAGSAEGVNSFDEYVRHIAAAGRNLHGLHHRTDARLFAKSPFYFILDQDSKLQVDFVIKYEQFIPSLALLLKENESDLGSMGRDNETHNRKQSSSRDPHSYQKYYTPELVDFVNSHYKSTLDLFGYQFGDTHPAGPAIYVDPA